MDDKDEPQAQAQPSVLQMTIQITRAATGKVEEYVLTGIPEGAGSATWDVKHASPSFPVVLENYGLTETDLVDEE